MLKEKTTISIDNGNGQEKGAMYLPGQKKPYTWKIPNGYTFSEPEGGLNQDSLTNMAAQTFYLETDKGRIYFGSDILRTRITRRINDQKYKPEYMTLMFSALMAQLVRSKKKLDFESLGVITVNAGMPSKPYQDKRTRDATKRAYQKVFGKKSAPWYVKGEGFNTFRLTTRFGELYPEATTVAATVDARGFDLVLVGDIGFGTNDWVIYCPKTGRVLSVGTLDNGLRSFFYENSITTQYKTELDYVTGYGDSNLIKDYFQIIWDNLYAATMAYKPAKIKPVLIGGTKLIPSDMKSELKSDYKGLTFGDEFNNVLAFLGGGV